MGIENKILNKVLISVLIVAIILLFGGVSLGDLTGSAVGFPGWGFCSSANPCNIGGGDCDSSAGTNNRNDCQAGLVCNHDVGSKYYGVIYSRVDVCESKSVSYVAKEFFLDLGNTQANVEGKTLTFITMGSNNEISIDVDGVVGYIDEGQTKVINEIEITNKKAYYDGILPTRGSVLLSIKVSVDSLVIGECSPIQPSKWDGTNWVDDCNVCGCSEGYTCSVSGSCLQPTPVDRYVDGYVRCSLGEECFLDIAEKTLLDGKVITLVNVGSNDEIMVDVDEMYKVISSGKTERINGIDVKNHQSFFYGPRHNANSAVIIVGTPLSPTATGMVLCKKIDGVQGTCSSNVNSAGRCNCV